MSTEKRTVVFFDFDGTLTTGDTLLPFLKFSVGKITYYRKLIQNSPVLVGYALKLVRNDVAKETVLRSFLQDYPLEQLKAMGQKFSEEIIPLMLRPEGMKKFNWHKEQGHECILVSASLDLYLSHWSKKHNFQALLCTHFQESFFHDKSLNIIGKNCFGQEKVYQIEKWMGENKAEETYAYGDSKGDAYMIEHVRYGYMLLNNKFHRK